MAFVPGLIPLGVSLARISRNYNDDGSSDMKLHKDRGRAIINKMVKGGTNAPITAWSEAKLEKAIRRNSVFRDHANELRIARVGGLISDLRSKEKEVVNASMSMASVLEEVAVAEEEGQDDSVPECEADLLLLAAEANSEANLARAAALEQLADNSFDAILITDLAGLIAYSNKAFTKLTGYDQADVIGKSPKLLQGPGTDEKVLARLKESMQNGRGDYEGSAINYKKNGTPFIMHWRVVPVKVCGQIKAWVAIQREGSEIPSEDLSSARFNLDSP
jgi:PAS domain S-box-containing protein